MKKIFAITSLLTLTFLPCWSDDSIFQQNLHTYVTESFLPVIQKVIVTKISQTEFPLQDSTFYNEEDVLYWKHYYTEQLPIDLLPLYEDALSKNLSEYDIQQLTALSKNQKYLRIEQKMEYLANNFDKLPELKEYKQQFMNFVQQRTLYGGRSNKPFPQVQCTSSYRDACIKLIQTEYFQNEYKEQLEADNSNTQELNQILTQLGLGNNFTKTFITEIFIAAFKGAAFTENDLNFAAYIYSAPPILHQQQALRAFKNPDTASLTLYILKKFYQYKGYEMCRTQNITK